MSVSYGEDWGYASQKIGESLVRWKDTLVYVLRVGESDVRVRDITTQLDSSVPLGDLNLEPIPLGYLNHRNFCEHLSRIPARQYRQGLRGNLLNRVAINAVGRVTDIIFNPGLVKMMLGKYPTMEECFEAIINEEATSKAFSIDFALGAGKEIRLYYKGRVVGKAERGTAQPFCVLDEKYRYLQELLAEVCHVQ